MSNNLPILKDCPKCGALIEAREKMCIYCKHVFEIPKLTPEEQAISYNQICEDINNAFFRFESFMYGNATTYQSFNFDRAFSILFFKTREAVNYVPKNFKLIGKYWELTQQITYDHDKTNYTNYNIDDNEDFINDLNAIYHLYDDRLYEFNEFTLPEDWEEKRLSILDIQKDFFESKHIEQQVQPKQILKKSKKKSKEKEVKNEFSKLINEIEIAFKYNYPVLEKPLQFYYNAKECIRKFKYVTPIKFKSFSKKETILALKHFDFVLNELLAHAQTDFKTIEKWLLKYGLQHYEIFQNNKKNELIEFLNQMLPSLGFSLSDKYNKDQEFIQYDFFNYWYGFFLMEASTFVVELNQILNPSEVKLGYNSTEINTQSLEVKKLSFEKGIPKLSNSLLTKKQLLNPAEESFLRNQPRNRNNEDFDLTNKNNFDFSLKAEEQSYGEPNELPDPINLGNQFESIIIDGYDLIQNKFINDDKSSSNPVDNTSLEANEPMSEMKTIVVDYLEQFLDDGTMVNSDYQKALDVFVTYFVKNTFEIDKPIRLKGRVVKRFALECGKIYREASVSNTISYEYLMFLKSCFQPFENEIIEKERFQKAKLYKYLTAKK